MRADYITDAEYKRILSCLPKRYELICRIMNSTGLRVGDVVSLTPRQLVTQRPTIHEQKTSKTKRVFIGKKLRTELLYYSGKDYCFPAKRGGHISRQSVNYQLTKAAKAAGIKANVTPHSFRKRYAVNSFKRYGLDRTIKLLNHDNLTTTLLYALSDSFTRKKNRAEKLCFFGGYLP